MRACTVPCKCVPLRICRHKILDRFRCKGALEGNKDPAAVDAALRSAQAAVKRAEHNRDSVQDLPSARDPSKVLETLKAALWTLTTTAVYAAVCGGWYTAQSMSMAYRVGSAALAGLVLAGGGYSRGSLSASGALSAAAIGAATFACSFTFSLVLLVFYLTSSAATKVAGKLKGNLDAEYKKGGQRTWVQVLCNAGMPTLFAIAYACVTGFVDYPLGVMASSQSQVLVTALQGGVLGYYACCCGDTWASELGILSPGTPRLITSMRPVRKGTNGGVSLLGLLASVLGGLAIGAVFYAAALVSPTLLRGGFSAMAAEQWLLVPLGVGAGFVGSLIDSMLGATLQFTGFDTVSQKVVNHPGENIMCISGVPMLSNNLVNLLSASSTALLTAVTAVKLFCPV